MTIPRSNLAAESRYFEIYIQPLLKYPNQQPRNIRYFFAEAWMAWRHSVQRKDMKKARFIEGLCDQLYKENEEEFLKVASSIADATNDTDLRNVQAEEILFNALKEKDLETIFPAQLALYKTFFESDFRLYGTIPGVWPARARPGREDTICSLFCIDRH